MADITSRFIGTTILIDITTNKDMRVYDIVRVICKRKKVDSLLLTPVISNNGTMLSITISNIDNNVAGLMEFRIMVLNGTLQNPTFKLYSDVGQIQILNDV
jgi:hypothetical protein